MKEEREYLNIVLDRIDGMIDSSIKKRKHLLKEVEDIGIPDLEQKSYFRKCKQGAFEALEKSNQLKVLRNNTHFGRMDLTLEEDGVTENFTMYLGESSIKDGINNLVYDWRSPVGNLYYMNAQDEFRFNETTFNLNLKRQILIKDAKIEKIFNSFIKGSKQNVTDDFLIHVLESKKNRNEFEDIIKSIQSNQNAIIRDDIGCSQLVQGVAGSGKTVVLLHRLSYLLYNSPLVKEKLIFITPSKIFQSKLSKINRSLSLTTVKMNPMEEYYFGKINYYLPRIKIDGVIKDNFNHDTLEFIYGDDFVVYLKDIMNNYGPIKKSDIKNIVDIVFKDLKDRFNFKNTKWIVNKKCIKAFAYIVLEIYIQAGFKAYMKNEYIFIDEMQDYSFNEYRLIKALEPKSKLSLYGDVEQAIIPYIKKKTLDDLKDFLHAKTSYLLNQNYRNSREITDYCNKFLNVKMQAMGISSDSVFEDNINKDDIFDYIKSNYETNHVIITNNTKLNSDLQELGYEAYTVLEAKGLEFSKVVVVDDGFSYTERYVSLTRTLDKLFILKVV